MTDHMDHHYSPIPPAKRQCSTSPAGSPTPADPGVLPTPVVSASVLGEGSGDADQMLQMNNAAEPTFAPEVDDQELQQALFLSCLPPDDFDEQLAELRKTATEPVNLLTRLTQLIEVLSGVEDEIGVFRDERARLGDLKERALTLKALKGHTSEDVYGEQFVMLEMETMQYLLTILSRIEENAATGGTSTVLESEGSITTPASDAGKTGHDAVRLASTSITLLELSEESGDLGQLEGAISGLEQAVEFIDDDDTNKPAILNNLGIALRTRFSRVGELGDIEKAIVAMRHAVELAPDGHPDKLIHLNSIGIALQIRFEHLGELEDIKKAVVANRLAAELTPDGHPAKPGRLSNLGNALQARFKRLGELEDIENAIVANRHAVELTPDDHPDKPGHLNNLGIALWIRFLPFGELEDIENAIVAMRRVIELTPDGHPDKPSQLNNLGTALRARFERLGGLEDIENAIVAMRRAVELTPDGHPAKFLYLNNIGTALQNRFLRLGELEDIEKAIVANRRAVELTPNGHPHKPGIISNLGTALQTRFERLGELEAIENAIVAMRRATELIPDGHPNQPSHLSNLGNSLCTRFERLGELEDLESAIVALHHAVELTPDGHADQGKFLNILGSAFCARLSSTCNPADFDHASGSFMKATQASSTRPFIRLNAAMRWADMCTAHSTLASHHLILQAWGCVLELIPQVVWLGHNVHRRYTELSGIGDKVNAAASAAITAGEITQALEWLEEGRSIVWGQILQLRTPMDDLRQQHPYLADRLERVSRALESAGSSANSRSFQSAMGGLQLSPVTAEDEARTHRALVVEYEKLLVDVRNRDGFQSFLRPKKLAELSAASAAGPVIVVNVHESRCDALVLCHPGNIIPVPLPNLSHALAKSLHSDLISCLKHHGVRERKGYPVLDFQGSRSTMGAILRRLWLCLVEPILQAIEPVPLKATTDRIPHITWCATGPLAFLPIHAAGNYGTRILQDQRRLMDFAVSSYTPSLTTLIKSFTMPPVAQNSSGILVISQPNTPSQTSLPGTVDEARAIRKYFLDGMIALADTQATVAAVLEAMEKHKWIHLACHGLQNPTDPTKSAFALYDGKLELSKLMNISLKHAELAVLSACQTATGDEKLPEEAVHLAAGMLTVGYKSVVGTMWSIGDADAPIVADAFYAKLLKEGGNGGRLETAYALHEAVKRLQEKVGEDNFIKWVPFVHFGL